LNLLLFFFFVGKEKEEIKQNEALCLSIISAVPALLGTHHLPGFHPKSQHNKQAVH